MVTDPQTHKETNKPTDRTDYNLQYTAPLNLARSVIIIAIDPSRRHMIVLNSPIYYEEQP